MPTIPVDLDVAVYDRIIDALSLGRGWGDVGGGVNEEGLTKAQYAKREFKRWVKQALKKYETDVAATTAGDAAEQTAETDGEAGITVT